MGGSHCSLWSTSCCCLADVVIYDRYASVPTSSLVPKILEDAKTSDEYLARLAEGDEHFAALRDEAEKAGEVLRYVGVIDGAKKEIKCSLER